MAGTRIQLPPDLGSVNQEIDDLEQVQINHEANDTDAHGITMVDGIISSSNLPSYVDDVLRFANLASFPSVGDNGKIYIDNDTGISYRWDSVSYFPLTDLSAYETTTQLNDRDTANRDVDNHTEGTINKLYTATEKSKLASMTAIFTSALKTAYDSAVTWILDNGTNILNHLSNTSNPHNVTPSQIGLGSVVNADTTTTANINDSLNKRFVTEANLTTIGNQSGTNTGDNAVNSNSNGYTDSSISTEVTNRNNAITTAVNNLKDGVASPGDTLNKLYNIIIGQTKEVAVATIAARNALDVTSLPTNVFVTDDGDGNWALYKATTTGVGATFVKLSDPDLLNSVLSASQIKSSYESNSDTNVFTNALKTKLDAISGTNTGNETATTIGALIGGSGDATPNDTDYIATSLTAGGILKRLSWTNAKAFLKTYYDTLYTSKANNLSDVASKFTSRSNLNLEKTTNGTNANYSILNTDKVVLTGTALTASRTWTLPDASTVNAGHEMIVGDFIQTVTSVNTIVIACQTGQKINNTTNGTEIIKSAGGFRKFISDGVSNWVCDLGVVRLNDVQTLTNKTMDITVHVGYTVVQMVALSHVANKRIWNSELKDFFTSIGGAWVGDRIVTLTNNSGVTINANEWVLPDSANDLSVVVSLVSTDGTKAIGWAALTATNGSAIYIEGCRLFTTVASQATTRGQYIVNSTTTVGRTFSSATTGTRVQGIALTAAAGSGNTYIGAKITAEIF